MVKQTSAVALERFLSLALLASLGIAQPLLNLVGTQAEFLVAHRLGRAELLLFALALGLLVPVVTALVPVVLGKMQPRLGSAVFYLLFGILAGLALLPVFIGLGWTGFTAAASFAMVALLSPWMFHRFEPVRLFFRYFSPAVLIFPLAFLFFSRATALFLPQAGEAGDSGGVFTSTPDIVFLVLDEFPLVSLLDENLEIDRRNFPNFARLADQATWYREASSPAETTVAAVPALLSGLWPDPASQPLPIAANYPRNLFSLLQGRYLMLASETATRLCPGDLCQPFDAAAAVQASAQNLFQDLWLVYLHLVTPRPWSEDLPSISNAWSGFTREQTAGATGEMPDPGLEHARVLADLSENVTWSTRADEVGLFISAIEPRPEPALYYLHSLLPHAEWRYMKNGQQYLSEERWEALLGGHGAGIDNDDVWAEDEFAVQQYWQRHLWQVQYVDTLLGQLLDRLEDTGMLDSTLLIVTGDHGAGFMAGQPRRSITGETLTDISAVPLFIKHPGQRQGRIDDQAVSLIDVLPTLAQSMGAFSGWEFDGQALGENPVTRDTVRILKKNGRVYEYPVNVHRSHLQQRAEYLAKTFQTDDLNRPFALGPYPELLDRNPAEFVRQSVDKGGQATIENARMYLDVHPEAPFVPRQVKGTLNGLADLSRPRALAISVNGRIAATSQTLNVRPYQNHFSALLAADALRPGPNDVQVYLIEEQDKALSLVPLSQPGVETWKLSGSADGEVVSAREQAPIPVQAGQASGRVYTRQTEGGSLIRISGMAEGVAASASEVLVFMDGELAAQGNIVSGQYAVLAPPPGGKHRNLVSLRVILLRAAEGQAWETEYPAPCSADWLFASPHDVHEGDCGQSGTPLALVDGRHQATIDLDDPDSLAYLTRGWGTETAGIAWSMGKSSSISIPVPAGLACLQFRAEVKPFLHPPALRSQSLWLTTNGVETESWVLDQDEFAFIDWQVSEDTLDARPGTIEMELFLPDATSPASVDAGMDQRTLGIALLNLEIQSCR